MACLIFTTGIKDKFPFSFSTVDQQTALALILELAVQQGTLSHILSCVLLLLNLWNNSRHDYDNRITSNLISAPLIPLLKRFQGIQCAKARVIEASRWDEVKFL